MISSLMQSTYHQVEDGWPQESCYVVGLVLISFAGRLENMQLKNISQNYIPQYTKYLNNVIKCVVRKWLPIYYISINIWNRHFIVVEIFEKFIFWKYNIKH